MKYIREIVTACYMDRKLKTLFSYVFVFLFHILRHDIYFTMVVLLVEELGHVVLAAGNIQLRLGPVCDCTHGEVASPPW